MYKPFVAPATLIARLDARAAELAGKKGAPAARALAQRITAYAVQHQRQMVVYRHTRSERSVLRTRQSIEDCKNASWKRGEHQELIGVRIPERFRTHPALRDLAAPLTLLERAKRVLPQEYGRFDHKGRGSALNIDLYGAGWGLVLVQVRKTKRQSAKGFLSVSKEYVLTDGCDTLEVPATRIKRAAAQDPSPDSPLRALKPVLPPEWAERIDADPLTLIGPKPQALDHVFKVVERRTYGALASVFDGSPWVIGEWRQERARRDHGGGLYAYAQLEEAQAAAREGSIFRRAWTDAKDLVLIRCEVGGRGRYVRHGRKLAFDALRPVEMVGAITHA